MNWLKQLFSRKRLYTDLEEEVAFHLAARVDELVAAGMPKKQAEAQAKREFGNVSLLQADGARSLGMEMAGRPAGGFALRRAHAAEESGADARGGADTGAGNWREHRDFHAAVWPGAAELCRRRTHHSW